jgi:hypothetical protein
MAKEFFEEIPNKSYKIRGEKAPGFNRGDESPQSLKMFFYIFLWLVMVRTSIQLKGNQVWTGSKYTAEKPMRT